MPSTPQPHVPQRSQDRLEEPDPARLIAEYEFVREGMRQDQRERLAFLGFALAAAGTVLGLLVRDPTILPTPSQALVLIGIALSIAIVAEVLTIRATIGVASAGHYLCEFIESDVSELAFQTRNRQFLDHLGRASSKRWKRCLMRASVSGSWGLAVAYGILTGALLVAWFTVDLAAARGFWRSALVVVASSTSAALTGLLWWMANRGARHVGEAWRSVQTDERSKTERPRS